MIANQYQYEFERVQFPVELRFNEAHGVTMNVAQESTTQRQTALLMANLLAPALAQKKLIHLRSMKKGPTILFTGNRKILYWTRITRMKFPGNTGQHGVSSFRRVMECKTVRVNERIRGVGRDVCYYLSSRGRGRHSNCEIRVMDRVPAVLCTGFHSPVPRDGNKIPPPPLSRWIRGRRIWIPDFS